MQTTAPHAVTLLPAALIVCLVIVCLVIVCLACPRHTAAGTGFGGRSLCLAMDEQAEPPYEVAVWVKPDDEAGVAGLAFAADGGDRHDGFYPSAGRGCPYPLALRSRRPSGPPLSACPLRFAILASPASIARSRTRGRCGRKRTGVGSRAAA